MVRFRFENVKLLIKLASGFGTFFIFTRRINWWILSFNVDSRANMNFMFQFVHFVQLSICVAVWVSWQRLLLFGDELITWPVVRKVIHHCTADWIRIKVRQQRPYLFRFFFLIHTHAHQLLITFFQSNRQHLLDSQASQASIISTKTLIPSTQSRFRFFPSPRFVVPSFHFVPSSCHSFCLFSMFTGHCYHFSVWKWFKFTMWIALQCRCLSSIATM